MEHTLESLGERLRIEAGLEIDSYVERYLAGGGVDDRDAFLSWLHTQHAITTELFCELHGGDSITTATLVGVRNHKTLILDSPARTLLLPDGAKTIVAGANAPTVAPVELPEGSQPGKKRDAATWESSPSPSNGKSRQAAVWDAPRWTTPVMTAATPPTEPDRPRYALLGCLGKGAMGEVHVARDEDLLRKVAYKRMVPEVAQSRSLAARFFSEIQVTAQLDHPNIVPIYGLEVANDAIGYSMKLVQGSTLLRLIDEARDAAKREPAGEPRRRARRLEIFLKVCDAVAYAHSKGVLHRDLKPENIMVGRYHEVYVMDWGICRLIGTVDHDTDSAETPSPAAAAVLAASFAAGARTQFGAILGTPAYMSPEQAAGRNTELDGRSDLYALGLILHEVVALAPAVSGTTLEGVLDRAQKASRDPLVHAVSRIPIPRELDAIIAKATAARPEDRYPSVTSFADDVRRFLAGEEVRARPDNSVQRIARTLGRHRMAMLATVCGLFVVGSAATIGTLAHEKRALAARARARGAAARVHHRRRGAEPRHIDDSFHRDEEILAAMARARRGDRGRTRASHRRADLSQRGLRQRRPRAARSGQLDLLRPRDQPGSAGREARARSVTQ